MNENMITKLGFGSKFKKQNYQQMLALGLDKFCIGSGRLKVYKHLLSRVDGVIKFYRTNIQHCSTVPWYFADMFVIEQADGYLLSGVELRLATICEF